MGDESISRLEFEHFIAEFEANRDTLFDEIADLRQKIELIEDALKELKRKKELL